MIFLSSDQMQDADADAIHRVGIPSIVLMENACRAVQAIVLSEYPKHCFSNVLVLAGKGNNGGDGIGVARLLSDAGYRVELLLFSPEAELKSDPAINFNIYRNLGYSYSRITNIDQFRHQVAAFPESSTLVIDALFGTGLSKPVTSGLFSEVIDKLNETGFQILSIDVPSGLSEKFLPGEGSVVLAHKTVSFQTAKLSHIYPDGNRYCGDIRIKDIGIPNESLAKFDNPVTGISGSRFIRMFGSRSLDAHKGDFGHCLNFSGSTDTPGASVLSSAATIKSGAGLCTTLVSPEFRELLVNSVPEVMTADKRTVQIDTEFMSSYTTLLCGPGIGTDLTARKTLASLIKIQKGPVVLDADALNIVADEPNLLSLLNENAVITPHPGEFSRLTGLSKKEILTDRIGHARAYATRRKIYTVLKGHHTIVATPAGEVYVNLTGNPGMATAGSGDVLSGILAGFITQYSPAYELSDIIQAAVFIHGLSGDVAKDVLGEISLTASDIIRFIPEAIQNAETYPTTFKLR